MVFKKCDFCKVKVPIGGQCKSCGFVDGFRRPPNDGEYKIARSINRKHNYPLFKNIDMIMLD